MHRKLFDLPKETIDQIVRLEAEVMIPILARSGIPVRIEDIESEIYKDQEQEILVVFAGNDPSAWIRFKSEGNRLFVKSIQLNGNGMLRRLLREIHGALIGAKISTIESVVQRGNSKSLSLHEKLGFSRTKESPKAIRYSVASSDFLKKLRIIFASED